MSPNGWTDEGICAEWFEKSFIPQATAHRTDDKPILLIFDGHNSHASQRVLDLAKQHRIELHCLPAHTTHKLQPLDVGVFAQLQRGWKEQCIDFTDRTDMEMDRKYIVREYMEARAKSISTELVIQAFKSCGLNPIRPDIFDATDFAPSKNTSIHAPLPSSFPRPSLAHSDAVEPDSASSAPAPHRTHSDTLEGPPPLDDLGPDDEDKEDGESDTEEPIPDSDGATEEDSQGDISDDAQDLSDDEWACETDEDVLEEELSTRHDPPCLRILRPDGTSYTLTEDPAPQPTATETGPESRDGVTITPGLRLRARSQSPQRARAGDISEPSIALDLRLARSRYEAPRARLAAYERVVMAQEKTIHDLREDKKLAEFHCGMAALEMEEMQSKLNAKSARAQEGRSRTLVSGARCLTSEDGLKEWQAQEDARQARVELPGYRLCRTGNVDFVAVAPTTRTAWTLFLPFTDFLAYVL